ncbi:MAG: tRNA (adenosine(37)-N6)-dimethylallyltransferase MiaA [Planctomycetaceae bacterium]
MIFPVDLLKRCWILAGPTASGKSSLGLNLADEVGAEIVALDSMTLYRGMDIGTAKPALADRVLVPHHVLDIIDPSEEFSVVDYLHAAQVACEDIVSRGRIPLFVGGTGLYLKSLLRGVFPGPAADWTIRERWQKFLQLEGEESLRNRLRDVDPLTANRLNRADTRRIIRALEIYELTGVPMSSQQQQLALPVELRPRHVFWISPPRDWLHRRIETRIVQMISEGWLDEARRLLSRERPLSRTARQALGYQELFDHLEGRLTFEGTVQQITVRTRQFAKRQHTWYRHLEECRPLEITGEESSDELVRRILEDDQGVSLLGK